LKLLNVIPKDSFFDFGKDRFMITMFKVAIFVGLPGCFLVSRVIREDDIKQLRFDESTIRGGKVILALCVTVTILLILLTSIIVLRR